MSLLRTLVEVLMRIASFTNHFIIARALSRIGALYTSRVWHLVLYFSSF